LVCWCWCVGVLGWVGCVRCVRCVVCDGCDGVSVGVPGVCVVCVVCVWCVCDGCDFVIFFVLIGLIVIYNSSLALRRGFFLFFFFFFFLFGGPSRPNASTSCLMNRSPRRDAFTCAVAASITALFACGSVRCMSSGSRPGNMRRRMCMCYDIMYEEKKKYTSLHQSHYRNQDPSCHSRLYARSFQPPILLPQHTAGMISKNEPICNLIFVNNVIKTTSDERHRQPSAVFLPLETPQYIAIE